MKLKIVLVSCSVFMSSMAFGYGDSEQKFVNALQSEQRAQADRERDMGRKPAKVMKFFGIEPGMTVLEILSSGGYYTEVLSHRVGEQGKVIAQNNKFILEVFDGRFAKEFDQRIANQRLPNVSHYKREFGEFDLTNEVDAITVVLNYHDLYSSMPKAKRKAILSQLKSALKPDGVLGIIDMHNNAKEHNPKLHRINRDYVVEELIEAGFTLDAEAAFLRNANDDYTKVVFDPAVRGKTDRFVLRFKKSA